MKKIYGGLFFMLPFALSAAYSNATTTTNGNITGSVWTYPGGGSSPTTKDTLFIYHDMFWNSNVNWGSSSIDVIIIKSGGSLGPDDNNKVLTLPSTAKIIVETGGAIDNPSGNASNHAITLGTTDIWGKKSCAGNQIILGPVELNISNPCGFVVLPVTVVAVNFSIEHNTVQLNWITTGEENLSHYSIERSYDGVQWEVIGLVSARNQSAVQNTYSYKDYGKLRETRIFYRIASYSSDGQATEVGTLQVNKEIQAGVKIEDNILQLNLAGYDEPYYITIYDFQGKKLIETASSNYEEVNIETLLRGNPYILRATSETTVLASTVIIR